MAFSREIIKKILQYVQFRVLQSEEKNSYYTVIGNTLVRISNHSTRRYVWDDMLEKNSKWKGLPIVSIVFEDIEDTLSLQKIATKSHKNGCNGYVLSLIFIPLSRIVRTCLAHGIITDFYLSRIDMDDLLCGLFF